MFYFKPLTQKDTIKTSTYLMVDKRNKPSQKDSIYRFLNIINDSIICTYENDSLLYYFSKTHITQITKTSYRYKFLKNTSALFMPAIAGFAVNITGTKPDPKPQITKEGNWQYYYFKEDMPDDSSCFIKTISFTTKDLLEFKQEEMFLIKCQKLEQYKAAFLKEIPVSEFPYNGIYNSFYSLFHSDSTYTLDTEVLSERKIKEGHSMIDFKAILSSLDTIQFSNIKESIVILDFWYKNCHPCWLAIQSLDSIYNIYKNNPNILIAGVNPYDKDFETALTIFKTKGNGSYPVLFTERKVALDYDVRAFPTIFGIDLKTKKIDFIHEGYSHDLSDKVIKFINEKIK